MNLFTGENKKAFEEWLFNWIDENIAWVGENPKDEDVVMFYKYPFEMQKGVIENYYNSVGIIIDIVHDTCYNRFNVYINDDFIYTDDMKKRLEAFTEAAKKANDLVNEN